MPIITVSTDGSSRKSGCAGWGAAFVVRGKIHVNYCHQPVGTNNTGEMGGVLWMITRFINLDIQMHFRTDSEYVQKGITQYRQGWEKRMSVDANGIRHFKNNTGKVIKNNIAWNNMFDGWDMKEHDIEWVRGHSGDIFNEIADFWANRGSDNIEPQHVTADECRRFWAKLLRKYPEKAMQINQFNHDTVGDNVQMVDFDNETLEHSYRN